MKLGRNTRVVAALVVVGAAFALARPAEATTISVTDETSYRNAITTLSGDNTGPHVVSIDADFTIDTAGDPVYTGTQPLTIRGNGNTVTAGVANTRFLLVGTNVDLAIEHLTVGSFSGASGGGAVLYGGNGAVVLTDTTFDANSSVAGGAVLVSQGTTTVTASTFTGNTAGDNGGAIVVGTGNTTITDSEFSGNEADDGGGAVLVGDGDVEVTGSTFTDNAAEVGGGLLGGDGSVTIAGSMFTENDGTDVAGAVLASGQTTVSRSTFTQNSGGSGGAVLATDDLHATDSTFTDNHATDDGGAGGALLVSGGNTFLTGSTLARNTANGDGSVGGALLTSDLTATNSTITDNDADVAAILAADVDLTHVTLVANGGEVTQMIAEDLTAFGSVIAEPLGGPNCLLTSATSAGHNRTSDTSCELNGPTDVEDLTDHQLQPLGDGGGLTPVRIPAATSPLVDAIPATDCDPAVPVDQRLVPRPSDGDLDGTAACDVGAVELPGAVSPESTPEPPATGPVAASPTFTG